MLTEGRVVIDRGILPMMAFIEDSVAEAILRLRGCEENVLFCVDQSLQFRGTFTLEDFDRWRNDVRLPELNTPLRAVYNRDGESARFDRHTKIAELMGRGKHVVPLVDDLNRLVAVARRRVRSFDIGAQRVGDGANIYVVAEIGINHNGDLALAKQLVGLAKEAGADAAKFQMRSLDSLYANRGDSDDPSEDIGSQYVLDVLSRTQLSPPAMLEVFDYCKALGIEPMCTPWDLESVDHLSAYGINAYKVASADLTNHDLLKHIAKACKPVIVSTGMSTESEVVDTVELLRRLGLPYALLHCVSTYPAPHKDLNLQYIKRLRKLGRCPVGYSGHERGTAAAIAAVACGAKIIEKHFTIDRNMLGNDHKVSLLPSEFRQMVSAIREVETALGDGSERSISQGERMNRETLAKSLVATRDLEAGEVITDAMLAVKSPGKGLQPNRRAELIGRVLRRPKSAREFFYESDLRDNDVKARDYRFRRPWGIPVRYHDYASLLAMSNMDLAEFHLSYKDLGLCVDDAAAESADMDLIVHSPDILEGDFVLDLAADDPVTAQRATDALHRCVDVAAQLRSRFRRANRPRLILSAGCCTKDAPLSAKERPYRYERLAKRLDTCVTSDVEVIFQTMPPFPWYFGGQHFANLFVEPEDTTAFCNEFGTRLCLDLSHTKLASNHRGRALEEYLDAFCPLSAHLHIVDGSGVDGEGLQIGDGEVDFEAFVSSVDRLAPQASFIPEIWQGHKNGGEGFWIALERLEQHFDRVHTMAGN